MNGKNIKSANKSELVEYLILFNFNLLLVLFEQIS